MNSDIKPDFEKLYPGTPLNDNAHRRVEGFVWGCDKIWTDHVEPLLSTVKRLQEENEKLIAWKQSEIEIWSPLLKYFQTEDKLIKLGSSISEEALRRSKDYVRLQEENERYKEALKQISEENYDDDDKKRHLYAIIDRIKAYAQTVIDDLPTGPTVGNIEM